MSTIEKEPKKNFTFSLKPSIQEILVMIAYKKDKSQSRTFEELVLEKAKKLKLISK